MKRFTETDKWRDPWFRRLSPNSKLAYAYLLDNVDNAGVWQPDFEMANFQIGADVDWALAQTEFGDRVAVAGSGKWVLTRFIAFQYGELREDCKPHLQVIRLIEQHQIARVLKGYPKGIQTPKDKDKDKDKDQDKDKDIDAAFESVWILYPKKKGKQEAKPVIMAALRQHGVERIRDRTGAYASAVAAWPEDEKQYVPDPVRWFKRGQFDDDPQTWIRAKKAGASTGEFSNAW